MQVDVGVEARQRAGRKVAAKIGKGKDMVVLCVWGGGAGGRKQGGSLGGSTMRSHALVGQIQGKPNGTRRADPGF